MPPSIYIVLLLLFISSFKCDRFAREELGISDRLRFTSGRYGYYNCTVHNGIVFSNFKIGIYVYNQQTKVHFHIDSDDDFNIETKRIENFYFAFISLKEKNSKLKKNQYKLSAFYKNTKKLIDKTYIKFSKSNNIIGLPTLDDSVLLKTYDNVSLASVIGQIPIKEKPSSVIFSMSKSYLSVISEFAVSIDGRVLVTQHLYSKKKNFYKFDVNVKFIGSVLIKTVSVTVKVEAGKKSYPSQNFYGTKVQESRTPKLIYRSYKFLLSEYARKDTILGKIKYGFSLTGNVQYVINHGNENNIFDLNSLSGLLSVSDEKLIDYENAKHYQLTISASLGFVQVLSAVVKIDVIDENDNPPVFETGEYHFFVPENAKVGFSIAKLNATDKDANSNGVVHFALVNTNNVPFTISSDGLIRLQRDIRVMTMPRDFVLYVHVFDSGMPFRQESEKVVTVSIDLINSHRPVLKQKSCTIMLDNGQSLNKPLLVFESLDEDVYDNITYQMIENNNNFVLNKTTGVLTLNSKLNRTKVLSASTLYIYAYDGKHKSLEVITTISYNAPTRYVNCVQNPEYVYLQKQFEAAKLQQMSKMIKPLPTSNPPPPLTFSSQFTPSLRVSEDIGIGKGILQVKIKNHARSKQIILFSITSGNADGNFQIDLFSGLISVLDHLDRESQANYMLNVKAEDLYGQSVSTIIAITLLDVNDNAPQFTNNGKYVFELFGTKLKGYPLGKVSATDKDEGLNGKVEYSFISKSNWFSIDKVSGQIMLEQDYNAGKTADLQIEVIAKDKSTDTQLVSYATVTISDQRYANRKPICLINQQKIEIPANMPAGVIVGRIFGYDPDHGEAGKLTYEVQQNIPLFKTYFSIHPETGLIRLEKNLTSEDKGRSFNIKVTVQDHGQPQLSAVCHLYKIIVNELIPVMPLIDFKKRYLEIFINTDVAIAIGDTFKKLETLIEKPNHAQFSIVDGDGIGVFGIDRNLGSLVYAKTIFLKTFYWLTIQLYYKDSSFFQNFHVLIKLNQKSSAQPYFYPSVYKWRLLFNADKSREVGQVFAKYPANPFNTENMRFTIDGGNKKGHFFIKNDGWIYSQKVLAKGLYALNVSVSGTTNIKSYASVYIQVVGDLLTSPKLSDVPHLIHVFQPLENVKAPYLLQVLGITGSTNNVYNYTINGDSKFEINSKTGAITTRHQIATGDLEIIDVNVANSLGQAVRTLVIEVIAPSNEDTISFMKDSYSFSVKENMFDLLIHDFADEVDSKSSDYVQFFIVSGNEGLQFYFSLSAASQLRLVKPLDYERSTSHVLNIIAFNGRISAQTTVVIDVINVNDNLISASQACFDVTIPENTVVEKRLITVKVSDADDLQIKDVTYNTLKHPKYKSPFGIDSHGVFTVKGNSLFDREAQDEYIETILAGSHLENTTFCVRIIITDENDYTPVFTHGIYNVEIVDSTPSSTSILSVYATDQDEGINAQLNYYFSKDSEFFEIDSKTGIVYVSQPLKISVDSQEIILDVNVEDNGKIPRKAHSVIKVSVIPDLYGVRFRQDRFESSVMENMPVGTFVTSDVKVNKSSVNYHIKKLFDECYNHFWVDIFTGIILTNGVLHSDELKNCTFKVIGSVNGIEVTSTIVFVAIEKRRSRPTFTKSKYEGSIAEGVLVNSPIIDGAGRPLLVKAFSEREEKQMKLRYKFIEDYAAAYFIINAVSGEILTNNVLDYEKHPVSFNVHIAAYDESGNEHMFSIVPVNINVTNVNDRVPVFDEETFVCNLILPSFNGTHVTAVSANDGDGLKTSDQLEYSLLTGKQWFQIEKNTGEIFVHTPDIHEHMSPLMIKVSVSDGLYSAVAQVEVRLYSYIVDKAFKFFDKIVNTSVKENAKGPLQLILVNPVGYRMSDRLSFELLSHRNLFAVEKQTGVIWLLENLSFDREVSASYLVHVQCMIVGSEGKAARVVVNITVEDENDNSPIFDKSKYYKAINVDTRMTSVIKVNAVDKDIGVNSKVSYSMKPEQEYFSCDPSTGEISLLKRFIKSEARPKYVFTVTATDHGLKPMSSQAILIIVVMNKDQPLISQNYEISIREDTDQGDKIVDIYAVGREGRQVYYEIHEGDKYKQFHIGFTSGELVVLGRLNHSVCSHYNLLVRAIDSLTGSWSETECDVTIIDVNDHVPIFELPFYSVSIKENAFVGSSVIQVKASDTDSNSKITFHIPDQIASASSFFSIDSESGLITTERKLDAENEVVHYLQVTAMDDGKPMKSSRTIVKVDVINVNDNKPVVPSNKLKFFVDDIKSSSQFIGKVDAFDADIEHELSFRLEQPTNFLEMNGSSGVISLTRKPSAHITLKNTVIVSDGLHQVSVPIEVYINMRNEYKPHLPSVINVSLSEDIRPRKRFVTNLRATDPDMGRYSELMYQIDSQSMRRYFRVNSKGKVYTTRRLLDRERTPVYVVPIRVTDSGGLFSLTKLIVRIDDENDNTPMFEFSRYQASIMTSQMSEESLLHVSASDLDEGINADLTYNTHGLDVSNSPLSIDSRTGLISLAGNPKGEKYQFSVQTSDNGYPVRQSRARIDISVRRWSDNNLIFPNSTYSFEVSEDVRPPKVLYKLTATMAGYDGPISYQFADGNWPHTSAGENFLIDEASGEVSLKASLDYEKVSKYKFMVHAFTTRADEIATTFLHVNVKNINDNVPKFDSRTYSLNISEGIRIGEKVLCVTAVDADVTSSNDDELLYDIIDQSENDDAFSLDSVNGWLTVNKKLDREKTSKIKLAIRVQDKSSHSDETVVNINIIDVNDSPPQFETNFHSISVSEDIPVQDIIWRAQATDPDENSRIEYYLTDIFPMNCFSIRRSNGDLIVTRKLKFGNYSMTVIAYDGLHVSYSYVHVNVRDVNDHWPVCLQSLYNIYVAEDVPLFSTVSTVNAIDGDGNDTLTYHIQGEGIKKFHINEHTGLISTTERLDYETQITHEFKVIVRDSASHTCVCDVIINIVDVNDNAPTFLHESYLTTMRENASDSSIVLQIEAHDKDSYERGQVLYTLDDAGGAFLINGQGTVTVRNNHLISKRTSSTFSMVVRAKDNGSKPLESSVKLEVIVLSLNDTPPQFDKLAYVFNVSENSGKNIVIGKLAVTASENLRSQKIGVKILNDDSSSFEITNDYQLKARVNFDYEIRHLFTFSLKAWFVDIPTLSSVVNAEVQVADVNDHRPTFVKKKYEIEIDENIRDGTFVLQTVANDEDGSKENSLITYFIQLEEKIPFKLDQQSGTITVDGVIDYERKTNYEFYVHAQDSGTPELRSKVFVRIKINDLNDNPPNVSKRNTSVIVQDSKPPNSTILEFTISDNDSARNAGPFVCSLLNGNPTKFYVSAVSENVCVVRNREKFDVEVDKEFRLRIRVKDSGTPQQYSDSEFRVLIVEESYHPPVIQDPKVFFIIVSKPYVMSKVGKVKVFDQDAGDIHQYRIMSGNENNYFTIQDMAGIIEGKPPKGSYTLSVEVNDGKFTDSGILRVVANELDDGVIYNSVLLKLQDTSARLFLQSKLLKFNEITAKVIGVGVDNVFVWSVTDSNSANRKRRDASASTTVVLAISDPYNEGSYMKQSTIEESIRTGIDQYKKLGIKLSIPSTKCSYQAACLPSQKCVVTMTPKDVNIPYLPSGYTGFVAGERCVCKEGFRGDDCSKKEFCASNPCKPGHKCIETHTSFVCECHDNKQCQQEFLARFIGSSYVKYELTKSFDSIFDKLEFTFRTESLRHATLFDASGKDSFRVEIKNGRLQCGFDFGGGFRTLTFTKVSDITDGNWHHVIIIRNGDFVSMEIDRKHKDFITGEGVHTKINGDLNIVFGARLIAGEIVNSFEGCLKDIRLHDKVLQLDYDTPDDFIKKVLAHKVQSGCQDSGKCSTKHCPTFSTCANTLTGYTCSCLPGHYGKSCATKMTCSDRPCRNGGKCTMEQMNDDITYKCTCPKPYAGAQCQKNLRACASNPCKNNAQCIPYGSDEFTCGCPEGFTGEKCQINLNPCSSSPCRNGGTCLNFHGDFKCSCVPGYSGRQCSYGENCKYANCKNSASCKEEEDSAVCQCSAGYTGSSCEYDVDECLSKNTCFPLSSCINTYGSYYCNCSNGITATSCGLTSQSTEDAPSFIWIGSAGGGVLILIIILVVIICLVKRRNHQNRKERAFVYTPGKRSLECEMSNLFVPTPPLRGIAVAPKYEESDQASAAMYDPSLINMSASPSPDEYIKMKFSPSKTSLEYQSDEEEKMPGYHWDYTEVPLDMLNTQMSREGSRIGISKTHQYYEDDLNDDLYVDIPQIPERPASRRSSMPTCTDCDSEIPEIPELPQQMRQSRNSLGNTANSSPTYQDTLPDLSSKEYSNRYSLLTANDSDITNVTRLYPRADLLSEVSDLSDELDGMTLTSFNSDEYDDDIRETDPLDTRKLERDIKKLFKDLQRRTEEDI